METIAITSGCPIMNFRISALLSLSMVTIVLAGPAYADPTLYQLNEGAGFTSGDLIGSISYPGGPPGYPPITFNGNVYIGPLNMSVVNTTTNVASPYTVYCTDIFNDYNPGGLYTLSSTNLTDQIAAEIGSSSEAAIKARQIGALLGNVRPLDAASGAAVQAAIWEIENEPGVTGYSVATGSFLASVDAGDEAEFSADVSSYLGNVSGTNGTNGSWQPSDSNTLWEFVVAEGQSPNQNFSFIASSGVGSDPPLPAPEPASLTMLGLGIVGLSAFRFRRGSTR